ASRGKNVRIVQMPITERVYGQWVNTQLIGGSAPDLCESGMSKFATDDQYTVRYFLPLGAIGTRVNPYNAGTSLEGVPWRDTLLDGMRIGYKGALLDTYSVATTLVGNRTFVNKTLLREVTGSDELPKTFGELLALKPKVDAYAAKVGQPIRTVTSCYNIDHFVNRYRVAMTAGLEKELDTNLDGSISWAETYEGFLRHQQAEAAVAKAESDGRPLPADAQDPSTVGVSFDSPQVKAYYEMMLAMASLMGEDHAAIDRQQGMFMFAQGRAVFLGTGSWDAQGLSKAMADKGWELGVIDFVTPGPGERWHDQLAGRAADVGMWGVPFAVYKLSRHQDIAIDFLMYLTSQDVNERYTQRANWPPVTVGARPTPLMAPFVPNPIGYSSAVDFNIGSQVQTVLKGQEGLLYNRETTYEAMVAKVTDAIRNPAYGGDRAWSLEYDRASRDARNQERVLAVQAARALLEPEAAEDAMLKLRRGTLQHVRRNNGNESKKRFEDLRGFPLPPV
ncbi:MAG TPA: extracellular solute-binding protein, partial [Tepidisphaeraceae bacterium]|nr:extracellular solute-binding protein [Tepidisphaeraceae bacterium]